MRPQDAEPLSVGGGFAKRIAAGALDVIVRVRRALSRAHLFEGRLNLRASCLRELFAYRACDR